jgi:hypothetical protein
LIYSSKTGRSPFLRVFACQTTTTTTINSISASSLHFNPSRYITCACLRVCVFFSYFFSLLLFRDEHRERAVGDVEVDPGAIKSNNNNNNNNNTLTASQPPAFISTLVATFLRVSVPPLYFFGMSTVSVPLATSRSIPAQNNNNNNNNNNNKTRPYLSLQPSFQP